MTCRTNNVAAIGVLIAVCLWTLPAYAQTRRGGHEPGVGIDGTGAALPLLLRGAKLTPDQKAQVKQIMANHRATLQDLFNQLRAAQDHVSNKLFSTEKLQEPDLAPEIQQISQLRHQLAEEGFRVVLQIRSILTPEQLTKAAQLKAQMQSLNSQMRSLWSPERAER